MARLGGALTGQKDEEDSPLRSIMSGAGDALVGDENSRRALLQIGLQMMQPVAMGQTALGHIGQSIGAGGEAEHRLSEEELKRTKQEDELDKANRMLDIRQQEANTYAKGVGLKNLIDRQALQSERLAHQATLAGNKDYLAIAKHTSDLVNSPAFDAKDPAMADLLKYRGKDAGSIAEMKRAEDMAKKGGAAGAVPPPASQDDAAKAWALANPNDPRAAEIRRRLGM